MCSIEHSPTLSNEADTAGELDVDIAKISRDNIGRCFSKLDVKDDDVGGTWGDSIRGRIVIDVIARSILIDEDD